MKRVFLAIICIVAVASIAVIAVFGAKIPPLISSASEERDFSDISIKTEALGMTSSSIASLMPLAQAFTGGSFVVNGTTDLPLGTTVVDLPGLQINLGANAQSSAAVQASGWTFTKSYITPDETTSVAVLSDDSDNNSVFATTTPPEGQTPSEYIDDLTTQYSDMLTLFGFEVTPSPSNTENQQTVTATQGDTVLEVQAWIDPADPTKVNIAALKSTEEAIGIAEADFATFVALLGGT